MNRIEPWNSSAQLPHEMDHLRFERDVEGGGGLVRDQERRIHRQRHGDRDALAHAAGESVRVVVDALLGIGDPDLAQHGDGAVPLRLAGRRVAILDVDHLGLDRHHGVQGGHGVLEDHGDPRPADVAQSRVRQPQDVRPLEANRAGADPGVAGEQPQDRGGQRGLPAAAFADHADDASRRHGEVHVPEGLHRAPRRGELDGEIADLQDGLRRDRQFRLSLGSKASRRASPRNVKPSVVTISGMPPAITSQGVSRMNW